MAYLVDYTYGSDEFIEADDFYIEDGLVIFVDGDFKIKVVRTEVIAEINFIDICAECGEIIHDDEEEYEEDGDEEEEDEYGD